MNARLDDSTTTSDPMVQGVRIVTMAITILGIPPLAAARPRRAHHAPVLAGL